MHKLLEWLWIGNPATKTIILKGANLAECISNITDYASNRNWKYVNEKDLYDSKLSINGKTLSFITDIPTRRCRVKIIVSQLESDVKVELSSTTFKGRPSGDPELNQRIVDGITNYLELVSHYER